MRGVPSIDVIRPNAPELKFVCVLRQTSRWGHFTAGPDSGNLSN